MDKTIKEKLKEALKDAPKIEGYTIEQLAEIVDEPVSITRWHIETLDARDAVEYLEKGRMKLKEKNPRNSEGL